MKTTGNAATPKKLLSVEINKEYNDKLIQLRSAKGLRTNFIINDLLSKYLPNYFK